MATLSVAIAAHPKREPLVDKLLERLPVGTWAVWDLGDDEWGTHERAWRCTQTKVATHSLVLQDDAVVCDDLVPALEAALDLVPDTAVVSLYFGNAQNHPKIVRAIQRARTEDAGWLVSTGTWWGVGIIIPTGLVDDMLGFCARRREVYDRRLSIWCEHSPNGPYPVYYPWPSLIDHLDTDSLVKPGLRRPRKAYQFIGQDASALDWDPNKPVVQCGRISGKLIKLVAGTRKGH